MSILFATPCYGGMATVGYMRSCVSLGQALLQAGVRHDWLLTSNESLIQRARNTSVATFLRTDFAKLMFIDADIEFDPEGVAALWNLNVPIACGVYPMKRRDMPLAAWKDGELVTTLPDEPFAVDYAGTGFLMIDRAVFEEFRKAWPGREHEEGHVGSCFAWFDPRVVDGIYLSEDYAFCRDARSLGYEILADPSIKLVHHGTWAYGEKVAAH